MGNGPSSEWRTWPGSCRAAGAGGQRDRARHRGGPPLAGDGEPPPGRGIRLFERHARAGVAVAADLVAWRRLGRGSYKPLLHHVTKGHPIPTRPVKMPVVRQVPRTLTAPEVISVLVA